MTDLVEVRTPVHGATCPDDHHYVLHAAVKTQCCRRLTERRWQLRCIQAGRVTDDGIRILENADAELRARVPLEDLDDWRVLEDAPLRLGDHILVVGETKVREVSASPNLESDIVYADGDHAPNGLDAGNLGGYVGKALGAQFGHRDFGVRIGEHRTFCVRSNRQHGNAVTLRGLDDHESLWVQRHGVGQKQSWGCGTFWPVD